MITATRCPGCGSEVTASPPDPLKQRPWETGIAVTMAKDITGEDVAQRWHALCRERDKKRRGAHETSEPTKIDWEAQAVLAEAEDTV